MKIINVFILLIFTLTSCEEQHTILGKTYAEQELKSALRDSTQHNVIDKETVLIKDSLTAISVVEPILFSIYGKDNIIEQRPYEIYFIDKYWILSGTLPEGYKGGTFLIIMDSRDGKIIRVTHGK